MSKHRPSTAREFCDLFGSVAIAEWQSGCHKTYKMPDGSLVTLPVGHGNGHGRELSTGLRCKLIKLALRYGLLLMLVGVIGYAIMGIS